MAVLLAGECPGWRVLFGGQRKEATDEKPPMKREVDKDAIQEVLGDLETRLERYLVEWRRRLGIQKGGLEASIDRKGGAQ